MSASVVLPDLATPEAFVAWMERQAVRHELVEGRLVMMAGGSNPHVTIAGNLLAALRGRLRGGPCRPFGSDFMVELDPRNRFYPDVSVACGETRDWTDRPVLVAEVLSPGTRRFDLAVKLPRYLACPGIRHLLYLEQDRALARLWAPGEPPGDRSIVTGLEAVIALPDLSLELAAAKLRGSHKIKSTPRCHIRSPFVSFSFPVGSYFECTPIFSKKHLTSPSLASKDSIFRAFLR